MLRRLAPRLVALLAGWGLLHGLHAAALWLLPALMPLCTDGGGLEGVDGGWVGLLVSALSALAWLAWAAPVLAMLGAGLASVCGVIPGVRARRRAPECGDSPSEASCRTPTSPSCSTTTSAKSSPP